MQQNIEIEENTEYIEVEDADISHPPEWIEEISWPAVYEKNDPNASWNLPK